MAVKKNAAAEAAKEEKKVEAVAAEKKAPAKAAAKKPAAKKAPAKKPAAKKAAAKKPAAGDKVVLQYNGKDIEMKAVVEACKADYKAKGHKTANNVCVYVKPEENAAYYTVAGKGAEDFKVEL